MINDFLDEVFVLLAENDVSFKNIDRIMRLLIVEKLQDREDLCEKYIIALNKVKNYLSKIPDDDTNINETILKIMEIMQKSNTIDYVPDHILKR